MKKNSRQRREERRQRRQQQRQDQANSPDPSMMETGAAGHPPPPKAETPELVQPMLTGLEDNESDLSAFDQLSPTQQEFVKAYFENGWNGTDAVLELNRATSRDSAAVISSRLLRNVKVRAAIREMSSAVHSVAAVTVESLVSHLVAPIFADHSQAFYPGTHTILPMDQMPRHVRNSIKSISYHDIDKDGRGGGIKKIEFRDPEQAAMIIARTLQLGGFADQIQAGDGSMRQVGPGGPALTGTPEDIRQAWANAIGSYRLRQSIDPVKDVTASGEGK